MALAGLTVDLLPSFVIIVTVFFFFLLLLLWLLLVLFWLPLGVFISVRVFYVAFCTVI